MISSKIRTTALVLALSLVALPAWALDLTQAKSQGLVGERADGLIGAVSGASADVQKLITDTNNGRLDIYRQQARSQGVSLEQYQAIAGKSLIERTPAGQFVNTGGNWVKK